MPAIAKNAGSVSVYLAIMAGQRTGLLPMFLIVTIIAVVALLLFLR
jgi:hypothetical protein